MSNMKLFGDGGPQVTNDRGGQLEISTMLEQQQSPSVAIRRFRSNAICGHGSFQGSVYQIQLSVLTPDMEYRD
jgi:hypothetical protein